MLDLYRQYNQYKVTLNKTGLRKYKKIVTKKHRFEAFVVSAIGFKLFEMDS